MHLSVCLNMLYNCLHEDEPPLYDMLQLSVPHAAAKPPEIERLGTRDGCTGKTSKACCC